MKSLVLRHSHVVGATLLAPLPPSRVESLRGFYQALFTPDPEHVAAYEETQRMAHEFQKEEEGNKAQTQTQEQQQNTNQKQQAVNSSSSSSCCDASHGHHDATGQHCIHVMAPPAPLSIQSAVRGCSLFSPRGEKKTAAATREGEDLFETTPLWIPHVALSREKYAAALDKGLLAPVLGEDGQPQHVAATSTQHQADERRDQHPVAVTSLEKCGEALPFVVELQDANDAATHEWEFAASSPHSDGMPNWLDLCVAPGNERAVAALCNDAFGWRTAVPLQLPKDLGLYITMFDDANATAAAAASRANATLAVAGRNKLAGIIPMRTLLPFRSDGIVAQRGGTPLVFLCACHENRVAELVDKVQRLGGDICFPIFFADGVVSILKDPCGSIFAVYHRTDAWARVKKGTMLTQAVVASEPMPMIG